MIAGRKEDDLKAIYAVVERKGYAKVSDVSRLLDVGFSRSNGDVSKTKQ